MRKGRDFRQPRRRGFDDDSYAPPPRDFGFAPRPSAPRFEAPSGPSVRAVVKWFNAEKGFGFVQLADGSGDAFLHASVVERSGNNTVMPGATLEVRAAPGQKGMQITEVLSVDNSTAAPEAPKHPRPDRASFAQDQTAVEEFGIVKFYNAERGFGFVSRDRGGKDAFVHASVLRQAGIPDLVEGQRVAVDLVEGRKGPEAVALRLI